LFSTIVKKTLPQLFFLPLLKTLQFVEVHFGAYFVLRWMRLFLLNKLGLVSRFWLQPRRVMSILVQQKADLLAGPASTI